MEVMTRAVEAGSGVGGAGGAVAVGTDGASSATRARTVISGGNANIEENEGDCLLNCVEVPVRSRCRLFT